MFWCFCALQIRDKLKQLKLHDSEVWEREERRKKEKGDVTAPWYIKAPFWLLCIMLDACFANRYVLLTMLLLLVLLGLQGGFGESHCFNRL
jgi:hypothetical protein